MKKLLLGCLIFITACQTTKPTLASESTPTVTVQTPTASATVTAEFTATPSFTPTPVPQFFTEEFDSTIDAWSSFLTSGEVTPLVTLENNALRLNFSSPNTWYYALHNSHEYDRVHLDAKFNSTGNQPVSMGLICNYSEKDGWIEFNLSTDGTYNVLYGQLIATGIAQYKPIVNDTSEYLTFERTDYEIGLTCEPNVLWLYINGKLFRKLNVTKYVLTKGKVGLAAAVFENVPVTAYFEWFKVSEPEE